MGFRKRKNFRGIKIIPFCLNANSFDGFGFYLLSINWNFVNPGIAQIVSGWSLFAINYSKYHTGNGGWKKRLWINMLGIFKKEFIIRQLIVIDLGDLDNDHW